MEDLETRVGFLQMSAMHQYIKSDIIKCTNPKMKTYIDVLKCECPICRNHYLLVESNTGSTCLSSLFTATSYCHYCNNYFKFGIKIVDKYKLGGYFISKNETILLKEIEDNKPKRRNRKNGKAWF